MGISRACTRVGVLVCMCALALQLACCELETRVYSRVFFKFDVDGTVDGAWAENGGKLTNE